jgi:hypothetical protein
MAAAVGYSREELAVAIRPVWLRAVREHGAAKLHAVGRSADAVRLRALPDDVTVRDAHGVVREMHDHLAPMATDEPLFYADLILRDAMNAESPVCLPWQEASAACGVLDMTEESAPDRYAEAARIADEVRAALPDFAERWAAALEVTT